MQAFEAIVLNLIAAAIFALAGYVIRPLIENFAIRKRRGLVGTWFAAVAPNSPNKINVVIQQVGISHSIRPSDFFTRKLGRLHIVCLKCVEGYQWKATASVIAKRDLVGEWWSTRPGAHQRGSFALVIASQGDLIYGYVSGMNDENRIVLKKWVLAKTVAELKHGFQLLREHVSKCDWDNHPLLKLPLGQLYNEAEECNSANCVQPPASRPPVHNG